MAARASILGTGLIGASMGQGLRAHGWTVSGWDPDLETAIQAQTVGAIDVVMDGPDAVLVAEVDLLVIAAPPRAAIDLAAELDVSCLVMDVTGVKQPVVEAAVAPRFIGTHPMAGREVSGPAAASPALFQGAAWVVVTDGVATDDLEAVEKIIRLFGARSVRMTAREHDEAIAAISHLPQVLAAALLAEAEHRGRALDLASGSFRDLTRVAASDPVVWAELLTANRGVVAEMLTALSTRLGVWAERIGADDDVAVRDELDKARARRRALAPPVVAVRVALADQPGELARVGKALEVTGVDVRDLQLRHAPHGGGGVLTLSVRQGEGATLRTGLEAQGLLLVD